MHMYNLVANEIKQVVLMSVKINIFKIADVFCRRFSAIKVQI